MTVPHVKLFNAVLCVFGAAAAVVDVAHRRVVCVRRGYHEVVDPDGTYCTDCYRYIDLPSEPGSTSP